MARIEQRVVGADRPKIGGQRIGAAARDDAAPAETEAQPAKRGKKWLLLLVALLVVAGAAYYFLVVANSADAGPTEPVPGVVQPVEAMSLNLVDGHYLRLGLGLQLVDGAAAIDDARARDAAIALFSGRTVKEVSSPEGRAELKAALAEQLEKIYDGDVMEVYLTDFVTQ